MMHLSKSSMDFAQQRNISRADSTLVEVCLAAICDLRGFFQVQVPLKGSGISCKMCAMLRTFE